MSRYIDIDKAIHLAIQAVVEVVGHGISQIDAVNIADKFVNAPTADVVEVVRCRDCKYCRRLKDGGSQCERIDGLLMTKPTDFCSYGERREK